MLPMNWKTFIAARLDNSAGNKNTSVFTKAWSPKQKQDQCFQTLTVDSDMVLFATDSNKKLLVLHSFKNAGGNLFRPEKKLMCLSGTGEITTVFEVNPLTLTAKCNLITSMIDALRECTTAMEVAELEAPDENGLVNYPGSTSFLPAPWLADTVVAANSRDPFLLITVVNVAATAFDLEHEEEEAYITSAADHDFILWAWGIGVHNKHHFQPHRHRSRTFQD